MSAPIDPRVKFFHQKRFQLRAKEAPELPRASGDSGFVAHLSACTHGATGWDWSFRLVRPGHGWAFITDGKLTLFVDEPNQYVPADAKAGDMVALRLPRARENLHPHRFTLVGGQGGCVVSHGYAKLFLPITFDAAAQLVTHCAGRAGDQLRFSLYLANDPRDFDRADAALLDVGVQDEPGVLKMLEGFLERHGDSMAPRGVPYSAVPGPLALARVETKQRSDLGDAYGWRRSTEAVEDLP